MSTVFSMITLGCAKNEVDSNKMRALLCGAGYVETDDSAVADVVIVNTCAFITAATEEAIATILEAADLPRVKDGTSKLIVSGCLPARYNNKAKSGSQDSLEDSLNAATVFPDSLDSSVASDLERELPEVAAFVNPNDEDNIVLIVDNLVGRALGTADLPVDSSVEFQVDFQADLLSDSPVGSLVNAMSLTTEKNAEEDAKEDTQTICTTRVDRIVDAPWSYIKIADGCSRHCSFCTIPQIRGHYRSRSATQILQEADYLVKQGVRELILIAQDTGLWHDNELHWHLPDLLRSLASAHQNTWIRIMYLQPQGVSDELLDTMRQYSNICNYLDIPLQHADANVLKQMNRSGSAKEYLQLLKRIRDALPDAKLRTTMIAGFPGETTAQAKTNESFVEQAQFDYLGVFAYSREDGTPAAKLPSQVAKRTAHARAQRIRDIADECGFVLAQQMLGKTVDVLICGLDSEGAYGRTQGMAPDVDGLVHIEGLQDIDKMLGSIVQVHIVDAVLYDLYGVLV